MKQATLTNLWIARLIGISVLIFGVSTPVQATGMPDLIITGYTLSVPAPLKNQTFNIDIDVKNQGTADTLSAAYRSVYIDRDITDTNFYHLADDGGNTDCLWNNVTGEIDSGDFSVTQNFAGGIVAGATNTQTVVISGGLLPGVHHLWLYTDPTCLIDESVGTNNVYGPITINIPSGSDTTGVFRPSNGVLFMKNANTSGFADIAINYGTSGDYPVTGDWDANGTATIGIYRSGSFYLRNSNTLGFADLVFAFGQLGDQPIAGDWDGDGTDTIGIFRPTTGQFLLRNSNSAGAADASFFLGNAGDVGIAGDWDGDGMDTTGVFRPSNGVLFMKNTNTSGFADIAINYGLAGDRPVTGDWDADGIDTIGVYRNGQFLLRNSNTLGFADIVFALGIPGDMPIAGDWDGIP